MAGPNTGGSQPPQTQPSAGATGTPQNPNEKLGIEWKASAAAQLASIMEQAFDNQEALKEESAARQSKILTVLKPVSSILDITSNALSDAQSIVSNKQSVWSGESGYFSSAFDFAETIINNSEKIVSNNSVSIPNAKTAANNAWNIVNLIYNKIKSIRSEVAIPSNESDFNEIGKKWENVPQAQKSVSVTKQFCSSLKLNYQMQYFESYDPIDYQKQAYNLSIAQTFFGLTKDVVDFATGILSADEGQSPQAILTEFLMNSVKTGEPSYEDLKKAVCVPNPAQP
ncbi:MAG: hypothetical protein R8G66_02075 [Cytophagales bacterium]|nr:hypothetical protein [Cytophagales bacterium]